MEATGCGFANTYVLKKIIEIRYTARDNVSEAITCLYESYNDFFSPCPKLHIDRDFFKRNFKKWKTMSSNWRKDKQSYFDAFSAQRWERMTREAQKCHTFKECAACREEVDIVIRRKFPNGKNTLKSPSKCINVNIRLPNNPKAAPLKDITREIYQAVNKPYEHHMGVSFAQGLTKVPEMKVCRRKPSTVQRREKRQNEAKIVNRISKVMGETAVLRAFGNNTSLQSQENERICLSESIKE